MDRPMFLSPDIAGRVIQPWHAWKVRLVFISATHHYSARSLSGRSGRRDDRSLAVVSVSSGCPDAEFCPGNPDNLPRYAPKGTAHRTELYRYRLQGNLRQSRGVDRQ